MTKRDVFFAVFSMVLVCVFTVSGCGKKEDLTLPDKEMRELSVADRSETPGEPAVSGMAGVKPGKEAEKNFYVYAEKGYFKNHYAPSGWMGDYGDLKINEGCATDPRTRRSCIKVDYSARKKQGAGWAGVYWQDPPNNWGNLPGGYDLTGSKALTFWAKGEKGGELIAEFKMGGISGEFGDSTSASVGPIALTPEWTKYTINLENEDLSRVIGGFAFVLSEMENPEGAVFYLDEIAYE
ncbi:MAG: hypothetical protein ABH885_06310 [Candidatus Omnitrophota bacterium]